MAIAAAAAASEKELQAYVLEQTTTFYGRGKDGVWKDFDGSRRVMLCNVHYEKSKILIRGLEHGKERDLGVNPEKWIVGNNVVPITDQYDLKDGWIWEKAPPGAIFFMPNLPSVGIELFYLPQWDSTKESLDSKQGLIELKPDPALSVAFNGQWLYHTVDLGKGRFRIGGPYQLKSTDGTYEIAGRLEKTIQTKPLRFLKMSGDCMISIASPKKFTLFGEPTGKLAEILSEMSQVAGHYRYVMVPIDSKEAKSISISKRLSEEFSKSTLEK